MDILRVALPATRRACNEALCASLFWSIRRYLSVPHSTITKGGARWQRLITITVRDQNILQISPSLTLTRTCPESYGSLVRAGLRFVCLGLCTDPEPSAAHPPPATEERTSASGLRLLKDQSGYIPHLWLFLHSTILISGYELSVKSGTSWARCVGNCLASRKSKEE